MLVNAFFGCARNHKIGSLACLALFGLLSASFVSAEEETAEMAPSGGKSSYIQLSPFIVNVHAPGNRFRYLKADVALKVQGNASGEAIEANKPLIQHSLVMLLSRQELENVSSAEGIQALKTSALDEVMHALESEVSGVEVDEVLFTNFLVE